MVILSFLQQHNSIFSVTHSVDEAKVEFTWKRQRLFDLTAAQIYHDICIENPLAKVDSVTSKPKSKWRPLPMDTIVRPLALRYTISFFGGSHCPLVQIGNSTL